MKFLSGKKTYIAAFIIIILTGLHVAKYIDDTTYNALIAVAGSLGLIALRQAVN